LVKYLYLSRLSSPRAERLLYRTIRQGKVSTIVEIGVGDGSRAARMIAVAQRYTRLGTVRYTGIDLFEDRPAGVVGPTLKGMHKRLSASGARIRLVPGDPFSALARAANDLTGTDLVVVCSGHDVDCLAKAWFYVPRLLHPQSRVLIEHASTGPKQEGQYELLGLDRIKHLAKLSAPRRAA
jgi:hypothetical protein